MPNTDTTTTTTTTTEDTSPYKQLLDDNANLRKEIDQLRNELKEVVGFNKELLDRGTSVSRESNGLTPEQEAEALVQKYISEC